MMPIADRTARTRRSPRRGRRTSRRRSPAGAGPRSAGTPTLFGRPGFAEERRVREHRREADGDDADEREGEDLLDVGEPPPAPPAAEVLRRRLEHVAPRRAALACSSAGDADSPAAARTAPSRIPCRGSSCSGRDSGRRPSRRRRPRPAAARSRAVRESCRRTSVPRAARATCRHRPRTRAPSTTSVSTSATLTKINRSSAT